MIRANTANAAVFTVADMKAVTGSGAPSYTSGVQRWNGAAATLNASPTSSRATPDMNNGDSVARAAAHSVMS